MNLKLETSTANTLLSIATSALLGLSVWIVQSIYEVKVSITSLSVRVDSIAERLSPAAFRTHFDAGTNNFAALEK